jgi:ribonuclease BN (tRNA processing enzyme)
MVSPAPPVNRLRTWLLAISLTVSGAVIAEPDPAEAGACPPQSGVAVQVLGSGGPVADDGRASSAYLLWIDGRARALVDAGGGAFLRFGEAGARFADLDIVALSHFHTDHSADLPALLKSGYFSDRSRPLTVSGPDGDGPFPTLDVFLERLIGSAGAFAYLGGYLDGSDGLVRLEPRTLAHAAAEEQPVFSNERLTVDARGVPHGIVPALAYRVRAGGRTMVFASDQNGQDERFVDFARGAELLVAHLAVPESASGAAVRLHARPSTIGRVAERAGVRRLLLSHFMARSLRRLDEQVATVRGAYSGPVDLAEDLRCIKP